MSEPSKTSKGVVTCLKYLSQRSEPVENPALIEQMKGHLEAALSKQTKCAGLAAIQIGFHARMAIYKTKQMGIGFLINPKIISRSGKQTSKEGCMSFRGVNVTVERAESIIVETDGKRRTFTGFAAAVVQHEIDHMAGITVLDRAKQQRKQRKQKKR
jgi:peptide deformylase